MRFSSWIMGKFSNEKGERERERERERDREREDEIQEFYMANLEGIKK
jgi:hypothetical protein